MRRKLIFFLITIVTILFLYCNYYVPSTINNDLYYYYTNFFKKDTGSSNAVTAIYLFYRVFDTLFEALMLLISVIAVIYFSRHKGGYNHE